MRVLLVRPRPDPASINLQRFMICEPLELETVAAYLTSHGHQVDLVDLILEHHSLNWFLRRGHYDFVGFTAYINHVQVVKRLARQVKRASPSTRTVVGGVHAEVVPTDFADPAIDYVLWANALQTMAGLASLPPAEATSLPGVWGPGKVRPDIEPLSGVFPDREITAQYRARYNYIFHDHCATLKTSYGCPFKCRFCFCTQICQYFERDLDEVMAELEQIPENNVFIVDDNFLYRPSRLREFCAKLDQHGIVKKFIAFGRADFITHHEDIIQLLARHGFEAFFVGLESFRAEELDDYGKRTSVQQNIAAVRTLEHAGVQCYAGIIVGPDWTKADFDALVSQLNQFDHPAVNIQPITPMPGTPLFDEATGVTISREHSELWDMAHLSFKPQKMSARAYYWNILRAYLNTSATPAQRRYLLGRWGRRTYNRVRFGAAGIAWQYIKLVVKPGKVESS